MNSAFLTFPALVSQATSCIERPGENPCQIFQPARQYCLLRLHNITQHICVYLDLANSQNVVSILQNAGLARSRSPFWPYSDHSSIHPIPGTGTRPNKRNSMAKIKKLLLTYHEAGISTQKCWKCPEASIELPLDFHCPSCNIQLLNSAQYVSLCLLLVDTGRLPTKRSPSWLQRSALDVRTAPVHEQFPPACQLVPRCPNKSKEDPYSAIVCHGCLLCDFYPPQCYFNQYERDLNTAMDPSTT